MTGRQLRKLIDDNGLTVRGTAVEMGIHERTLHRYLADEAPIPKVVELAIRAIVWGIQADTINRSIPRGR